MRLIGDATSLSNGLGGDSTHLRRGALPAAPASMTPATTVTKMMTMIVRPSIDRCDRRHIDGWRRQIDTSNRCDHHRCDRCYDDATIITSVAVFLGSGRSGHPYRHCERCY